MLGLLIHNPLMARGFNPLYAESLEAIAGRLFALRKALDATQEEMARAIGSGPGNSIWANYEAADRRISLDHALMLCRRHNVTLEWIYRGYIHASVPTELADKIRVQEKLAERRAKS